MTENEIIRKLTVALLETTVDLFHMKAEESNTLATEAGMSEREAGVQEGRAEAFEVACRYLEPMLSTLRDESKA